MRWKLLFGIMLLIGISGLLMMRISRMPTISPFSSLITAFLSLINPTPEEFFPIRLTTSVKSFYENEYMITNATFYGTGSCIRIDVISPTLVRVENDYGNCNIHASSISGKFTINSRNVMKGMFDTINIEILPKKILITGLKMKKVSLSSVDGEIKRLKGDVWSSEPLSGDELEIVNFVGVMKVKRESVSLDGYATRVIGPDFSWSG